MKSFIINIFSVIGLLTITDIIVKNYDTIEYTESIQNIIVLLLAILVGLSNKFPKPTLIISLSGFFITIENIANWISNVINNIGISSMSYDIVQYILLFLMISLISIATEFTIEGINIKKIIIDITFSFVIILIKSQLNSLIWLNLLLFLVLSFLIVMVTENLTLRKIK